MLWKGRSQKANVHDKGFTPYLYASGVGKSVIGVLNRAGLCGSYRSMLDILADLSADGLARAAAESARGVFMIIYDNVNFALKKVEQRLGRSSEYKPMEEGERTAKTL